MSSEFADLARDRQLLQDFCKAHIPSILAFKSGPSFKLNLHERDLGTDLHHLTSTGTCIESLLDCPDEFVPEDASVDSNMAPEFASLAINRSARNWKSEGSARIYCRCRALPFVIKHIPDYDARLARHIKTILKQLSKNDRFAIGEADPTVKDERNWYPPNAFHTYWFLSILKELETRFSLRYERLASQLSLERLKDQMLLWARAVAGRQISLHVIDSSTLDSDQLAWSLAILTRFGSGFQSHLADQDFLREGFKALFDQQTPAGTWHQGRPLFHYREAGNAYCYVYETFSVLLKTVLERQNEGEFLRATLRPFLPKLMTLWRYAMTTPIPLLQPGPTMEGTRLGWSSGHRIDHVYAESWATASVFSYAQSLRRLLGVWTREVAGRELRQVVVSGPETKGLTEIADRGETWPPMSTTEKVAEQLLSLFVRPAMRMVEEPQLEPDYKPIRKSQARSAIFFGPPGTSKTNLAAAVSRAIGWHYVELHASHFVAEGLPVVQRTADEIFQRLMQLDHTVILFDEIDELVRERDVEPDAFGRFLTTSMLPKLAELWKQRKVIYFIATNHIEYFDRAVTRAQRFDALIFVTPPSFNKKVQEIERLLNEKLPGIPINKSLQEDEITNALMDLECSSAFDPEALLDRDHILAKFILLRWDQLEELSVRLLRLCGPSPTVIELSTGMLSEALSEVADPSLQTLRTYCAYRNAAKYSMRDFGKETA
jgi:hypothetical protein